MESLIDRIESDVSRSSEDIPEDEHSLTPRQVLYNKMCYYEKTAHKLASAIIKVLKSEEKSRGDLLVLLHKDMLKFDIMAIECASKLAPYVHAKLSNIEVKSTIEHKFVMRTPTPIKDTNTWLEACNSQTIMIEDKTNVE